MCNTHNIPHLVNGAYFLQSSRSVNILNSALGKNRRVDAVVMSTDKNFMTPVGGALICCPQKNGLVTKVAQNYPGRASISPKLDLFMTLLEMGKSGYRALLEQQTKNYENVLSKLEKLAEKHETRIISANGISIALGLGNFQEGFKV